jgi:hypothetical protein
VLLTALTHLIDNTSSVEESDLMSPATIEREVMDIVARFQPSLDVLGKFP